MLFGREAELTLVDAALASSRAGRGSLLLFTGEAGIGKSSLAREAAERATAAGMQVAWGRCWEAGGAAPYWPWVQVFRALARPIPAQPGGREQTSGHPFDAPAAEAQDHLLQRFRLFDAATRELAMRADEKPLAILLDDLHAADLASLHFLLFVARQVATLPIAIIGAARDPEAHALPGVNDLLLAASREGEHVSLRRLSREAVASWVAGAAEPDSVYVVTEGNPLFVKEVLRVGPSAHAPSDTIALVLDAHLRLLPPNVYALVATASVLGRQFAVQDLAALSGMPSDSVREALHTACTLGVIEHIEAGRVQFTHVLLRERLYETLAERAALEWKVGRLLGERGAPPALVAHHLLEGVEVGDVVLAGHAALRAIEGAQTTLAFESAAVLAERVLKRIGPMLPRELACELEVAFGEALMRTGAFAAGRAQCVRAAECAQRIGSAEQLARAALAYGLEMLAASIDPVMVRLLEEALSALGSEDCALGARVRARLASALVPPRSEAEIERVHDLSRAALASARRIGDPKTLLWTLLFVRAATILLVHDDEVYALTEELVALSRSTGQRDVLMILGPKHALALLERGRRAEADAALAELVELTAEFRYPLTAWRLPMVRAAFALFDGRFDEAQRLGDEALALAQQAGTQQANVVWVQQRIAISIAAREPARVLPDTERLLSLLGGNPLFAPIRAWVLAAAGRSEEALRELESVTERDQAFGLVFGAEACVLLDVSGERDGRALPRLDCRPAAARLRPLLRKRWHGTRFFFGALASGFVVGPVARLLGELARLCGDGEEARALFNESRALCERANSPPFLELSIDSLNRLEQSARAVSRSSPAPRIPQVRIEREGDLWVVEGPAQVRFHLKHAKGLAYLSTLVASPGCEIHVLALLGVEHRTSDGGPVIDMRARAEYRERLAALDHEVAEAEKFGDAERANRGRAEVEALGAELARAVGIFGRERRAGSEVERARINVQRRIKDAIDSIERSDSALARYLRATVATGTFCCFTPV